MKFYERKDVFSYSWDQVAKIFWFRYPNPFSKHVQTEDILCRKVNKGTLYTKRLLTKTIRIAYFGVNLTIKNEPIIEESVIDPVNHTIETTTYNIGTSTAVVKEECSYKQNGEKQTLVERKAWIASSKLYFSRAIEAYLIRRFRKTTTKTCLGLQFVLEKMFPGAITENKSLSFIDIKDKKIYEKAKELASKSRPVPIFASCAPNKQ